MSEIKKLLQKLLDYSEVEGYDYELLRLFAWAEGVILRRQGMRDDQRSGRRKRRR